MGAQVRPSSSKLCTVRGFSAGPGIRATVFREDLTYSGDANNAPEGVVVFSVAFTVGGLLPGREAPPATAWCRLNLDGQKDITFHVVVHGETDRLEVMVPWAGLEVRGFKYENVRSWIENWIFPSVFGEGVTPPHGAFEAVKVMCGEVEHASREIAARFLVKSACVLVSSTRVSEMAAEASVREIIEG